MLTSEKTIQFVSTGFVRDYSVVGKVLRLTDLEHINLWLRASKVSLNLAKPDLMIFSQSHPKMLPSCGYLFNINFDGVRLKQT